MTLTPERLRRPVEKLGRDNQIEKAIEEFGEYIFTQSHVKHGKLPPECLNEELADCLLMCAQFKAMPKVSEAWKGNGVPWKECFNLPMHLAVLAGDCVSSLGWCYENEFSIEAVEALANFEACADALIEEIGIRADIDRIMEEKMARLEKEKGWV